MCGYYIVYILHHFSTMQLVFITEYMTSGSLLQFLKKAKRTKKSVTEKVRLIHVWLAHSVMSMLYDCVDVETMVPPDPVCTEVRI